MQPPSCTECGACCVSASDQNVFCDLTEQEAAALSPQFKSANVRTLSLLAVIIGRSQGRNTPWYALRTKWLLSRAGPLKGIEANVCCMLQGSLLHKVRCRIYDKRPSVCRTAVKPGDRACKKLRRALIQVSLSRKQVEG